MIYPKYSIKPRLKTRFFKSPYVVYDLIKKYKYWDDPSNGNGGGEYIINTKILASFNDKQEALKILNKLQEKILK